MAKAPGREEGMGPAHMTSAGQGTPSSSHLGATPPESQPTASPDGESRGGGGRGSENYSWEEAPSETVVPETDLSSKEDAAAEDGEVGTRRQPGWG